MGEEDKKPLRKLRMRGSKLYSTVEYGAKPKKGTKNEYLLNLNNEDFLNGVIDDYEWYDNWRDINNDAPKDHEYDQSTMIMPEITVHAGWSPKKVFHTTDAYADRSLQRSFNIIENNPDLYGKSLSKRFGSRSPSSFRKLWPEIIHSMPPGHEGADAITSPIGSVYTRDILNYTNGSKSTRAHELNHALWQRPLLRRRLEKVKSMLYDAYSPHEGDFDKGSSGSEIDELIASNSDLRNYIFDHDFDLNDCNFLLWEESETGNGEYMPYATMPTLTGYFPSIRKSIENYANERYNELINERGEDHADEIRQDITDEINKRIRLALLKVAYNQVLNLDLPLYAKSGGILIPKFGEGSGAVDWLLHLIAKVSPKTARLLGYTKELSATEKEISVLEKALQGLSKNLQGLQKGVQRAKNISKSQLFKELVSGLELEDRVSSELISRYNALDPNKQKAERDIVINLMKDGLIHSITDFDLAIDKISRGKLAKDPNLYKYKKLADFDSEHTLGYFLKLEEEKAAKEKYDQAFGSFEKKLDFPKFGLSLYSVPETLLGQTDLAYVMRQLDPKTPAPWCVLLTDKEGNPTVKALKLWNQMYRGPKYVLVDKKGKIKYFKSGNLDFFDKQDQPMDDWEKIDQKTGIKTSYNIIGKLFPFQFVMNTRQKTMSNGNEIELYYRPNGTLAQGYIRRPNNHTALFYPKNGPAEVTLYEKGPENVPSKGTWVTTPSGQRLFKTNEEGIRKTYDETGRLLMQTQGGYGTIFGPRHVLTFGNGEMALWDGNAMIADIAKDDYPLFQQHNMILQNEDPRFRQIYVPSTGELIKDGDDFKDIGDAILLLGFKFPIFKKGGVIKGLKSTKLGFFEIGKEIKEAIKEARNVPGALNATQLSGLKDMAVATVKHPKKVWKSIPLFLNGINPNLNMVDQYDFIADNFDFLNNFYKGMYKFKFGQTSEQEAASGLKHLYDDNGILLFNLKQRAQFAKNNGYLLDINRLIGDLRNTEQTFHYFPFLENGDRISENNLGWFNEMNGVHINTSNTRKYNTTASTAIHENEHAQQSAVADAIYSQNVTYNPSTNSFDLKKDLGNLRHTNYFPEELLLLDDIYHIDRIDDPALVRLANRDSRNLPYTSGDHRSPLEQGATNTEIKYIYANNYGVDFSKLKDYTELPDLIEIDEAGNISNSPFNLIPSKYSHIYYDNLLHNISEEIRQWKRNINYNYVKLDLIEFINGLKRKYNDALKKAVFYVGGLTGAVYLGNKLNSYESRYGNNDLSYNN